MRRLELNASANSSIEVDLVQKLPSVRAVKGSNSNRPKLFRRKVSGVHPHFAVRFHDQRFPMGRYAACLATDNAQRLVAPNVLGRVLWMADHFDIRHLVVRP